MNELLDKEKLWQRYVALAKEYSVAQHELFQKLGFDKNSLIVDFVRRGLSVKEEATISLEVAEFLTQEAQMELFDDLLPFAIELDHNHSLNKAEQIILSLPKDWLREKLRKIANQVMKDKNAEISTGFLNICFEIDKTLAKQLAEEAIMRSDDYSQDVGRFFLKKLSE